MFRVEGQSSCDLLYVNKPKCYPFNMAGYHDSKGLHLCELLETDKYRTESGKFHDNVMISVLRYYFFYILVFYSYFHCKKIHFTLVNAKSSFNRLYRF